VTAMGDIAVRVDHLSKRYRIGHREPYRALRDTLTNAIYAPFRHIGSAARRSRSRSDSSDTSIWALNDVGFEIRRGEVVGVIGRNGAGKSTLLKILSRITWPTSGRVEIHGRVGSLLEVGTGFHPELTGRENIYLNGAILGMKRREVARKFDEIVAFAEVEQFIDTPVKRFSSGMYMRLAFAVAAHLEPEILLVDEVLAVGDAAFQKKCLGKMGAVAHQGRTVIFVSHNIGAIKSLCHKGILLEQGVCTRMGPIAELADIYLGTGDVTESSPVLAVKDECRIRGSGAVRIERITIEDDSGQLRNSFAVWEPLRLSLELSVQVERTTASCWILFSGRDDQVILSTFQYDAMDPVEMTRGTHRCAARLDVNVLVPGMYAVSAGVFGRYGEIYEWVDKVGSLIIEPRMHLGKDFDNRLGLTTIVASWKADAS